jgi:hypothetical protein
VIHIIDSVLIPPINFINTVTAAKWDGYISILVQAAPDPLLVGITNASSDWTLYVSLDLII